MFLNYGMTRDEIEIAKRCQSALENSGLKAKDLAAAINKSQATVSDYLNGAVRIPVIVMAKIVEMTGDTYRNPC